MVFLEKVHQQLLHVCKRSSEKGCKLKQPVCLGNCASAVLRSLNIDTFHLRTFAQKLSNIDFSPKVLPLKDDEVVMSEMRLTSV